MQPHPAPFSAPIIEHIRELMRGETRARVLDPFGGTGRVLDALPAGTTATIIDIEACYIQEGLEKYLTPAEYNALAPIELYDHVGIKLANNITAHWYAVDSRIQLRRRQTYTHIITSPTYGNRFTDGYRSKPGTRCRSYAQSKGGALEEGNTGQYKFGSDEYVDINFDVMEIAIKRLVPGGKVIINVSDFYKTYTKGGEPQRVRVVAFWVQMMHDLGLNLVQATPIVTRRFKEGENRHRVDYEVVAVFQKEQS